MSLFRTDFSPSFLGNFLEFLVNDFPPLVFWVFFLELLLLGCQISGLCLLCFLFLPPLTPPLLFWSFVNFSKLILGRFLFFSFLFFFFLLIGPPPFPGGPVVKTAYSHCRGIQVQSLVKELRSHILHNPQKLKYIKKNFNRKLQFKKNSKVGSNTAW